MKKSGVAIALIAGFLAVVVLAAGVVAFGYFAANGIAAVPTDAQKRLVLSTKDFEKFDVELDPKCAKLAAHRNLDRTFEVEYVHDCEQSTIYVSSSAEINPTERDARQSFLLNIGVYKAGVKIGSGTLAPRDELMTLGQQHFAGEIRGSKGPFGNIFIIREGRVVHTVLMTGLYFSDPKDTHDLLTSVLEESRRQFPPR